MENVDRLDFGSSLNMTGAMAQLATALQQKHWRLATAESCTGGLIATCCTDLPGSSAWFEGGVVAYSNAAKMALLGVSPLLLEQQGAVSQAVAMAMAEGAVQRLSVDCALATTGIAGPAGGTIDKPIGLVWLAWAFKGYPSQAQALYLDGNRAQIRWQATFVAIQAILHSEMIIKGLPPYGN